MSFSAGVASVSLEKREIIARLVEVHAAREGLVGICANTRADLGEAFGMGGVAKDEQEEECDGTKEGHARIPLMMVACSTPVRCAETLEAVVKARDSPVKSASATIAWLMSRLGSA